jgi:hypothetical protein
VLEEDPLSGEALCPSGADVVLVHRVEHVRAEDAPVEADEEHGQHEPGQDQMVGPLDRALRQRVVLAVGEERMRRPFGEEVAHDDPEPEDRHRDAD